MLSDDDFLRNVLPHLRAKRAAQGRSSDSLHDSPGQPDGLKNDPNDRSRSPLWFPTVVSQRTKLGDQANIQVNGCAEPLSADLDTPRDGWITLESSVLNLDAEPVTLIALESRQRKEAATAPDGTRCVVAQDVYVLRLKGLTPGEPRFYTVVMLKNSMSHDAQVIMRGWEQRQRARDDFQKKQKVVKIQIQDFREVEGPTMQDVMQRLRHESWIRESYTRGDIRIWDGS